MLVSSLGKNTTCAKEEVISYFMLVAKKLLPMNKDEKSVAH